MKLGIVGLGYVGLPLAVEFAEIFNTVGFDVDPIRISELQDGFDRTMEVDNQRLRNLKRLKFSSSSKDLLDCDTFIVTVPTPIDQYKEPDLSFLKNACITVGKALSKGSLVVFESTVFPGATEEVCVPILESISGLIYNVDFHCGYSPERINPGDRVHNLRDVVKITSGSTPDTAIRVNNLYSNIISAGTKMVSSIKVAEAAKVIENTQRDLNIAIVNELALIFQKLSIDTEEVLEAAATKWNFMPFKPGLVGGHCIGVDPYYLAYKAKEVGHHPELILSGRKLNDSMGQHVADACVKLMASRGRGAKGAMVLILGLTFKENCPDIRNTKIFDIAKGFEAFGSKVHIFDPWVQKNKTNEACLERLISQPEAGKYDAIVLAVAHEYFRKMGVKAIRALGKKDHVIYDVKYVFSSAVVDGRL